MSYRFAISGGVSACKGSNPNIIVEARESLLDLVEFDHCYHNTESTRDGDWDSEFAARLAEVIRLLESHGAKSLSDLRTNKVAKWLHVFGARKETGLLTSGGFIEIDQLDRADDELIREFRKWLDAHWDSFPGDRWDSKPADFDREKHNSEGRNLARRIAPLVPGEITVTFIYIDADDEARRVRNVRSEVVQKDSLSEQKSVDT